MGDRTSVQMIIGGDLPASRVAELIDALSNDRFSENWSGDLLTEGRLRELTDALTVYAAEVNYADTSDLDLALSKLGLAWEKTWASGGGYPAGGERTDAKGWAEYLTGDMGGQPAITAGEVRSLGSLEAVLEHLDWLESPLPPLRIVEG